MDQANDENASWDWTSMSACSGVFAVTSRSTGRNYFIAVADMRQRAYDHHRLLSLGLHHNAELQAAWSNRVADFYFHVVEVVSDGKYLPLIKQAWIARSEDCFNRKNALKRNAF